MIQQLYTGYQTKLVRTRTTSTR